MGPTPASMTRTCPVCSCAVREDALYTHVRADLDTLGDLMRRNPSWILPDGTCPRGMEELRAARDRMAVPTTR